MLEIYCCTKDHGWDNSEWYESKIGCSVCAEKYALRKVGRQFGLFERAVLARNEERKNAAWNARKAFMADPRVEALLDELAALLDRQSSDAARHRLLVKANLGYVPGIGTFRKRWKGAMAWVKEASPDPERVLAFLRKTDADLVDGWRRAKAVDLEPEHMIGEPVHTLAIGE